MRRSIGFVLLLVTMLMLVPVEARAAELDEPTCESFDGAWWEAASATCFAPGDSLVGPRLSVPAGVTLTVVDEPPQVATLDALVIEAGGILRVQTALTLMQPITNHGTIDIASYGYLTFLETSVTNFAEIGGDIEIRNTAFANRGTLAASIDIWDKTVVDNYGTATLRELLVDGAWINHCGSSYSVASLVDEGGTVSDLECSIATTVDPDPPSGEPPLTVTWTIGLTNDGDEDLSEPQVELSTDGGATPSQVVAFPPSSGDSNSDGVLNVAETWSWTVGTEELADVTITAIASATAPSGLIVTFPDDPEAQVMASVAVAATTTTTMPATTTTAVLPVTGTRYGSTVLVALALLGIGVLAVLASRTVANRRAR